MGGLFNGGTLAFGENEGYLMRAERGDLIDRSRGGLV